MWCIEDLDLPYTFGFIITLLQYHSFRDIETIEFGYNVKNFENFTKRSKTKDQIDKYK